MSVTDELLHNAEAYEASFDKGELPLPPARRIAILACMDARLNPYGLLGLTALLKPARVVVRPRLDHHDAECSAYHRFSASGSSERKKSPPIPVT